MNTKAVTFTVGKKGRVVIPADLREAAQIVEGTELSGRVTDSGQVVLETKDVIKRRIRDRAAAATAAGSSSVVDELLDERRSDRSWSD